MHKQQRIGRAHPTHRSTQHLPLLALLLASSIAWGKGDHTSDKPDPYPSATPQAVVDVSNRIFPAVVRLDVAQEIYAEGKRTVRRGIGSGVIIDEKGRILTNFHVAGRAAEIFVTLYNKERVHGKLIGDDHWTDLAVVQMDMDEVKRKHIDFAYADLGRSSTLQPCENVMAIGTPHGFARTVTLGEISNPDQVMDEQLNIGG